jgi:hypothetical protein
MHERTFKSRMLTAKAMETVGERPDYWIGYQRGLRRFHHGEIFGTDEEHDLWMGLADDEDQDRAEMGRGYRDGYSGKE